MSAPTPDNKTSTPSTKTEETTAVKDDKKPATQLEEDDEFEDFPVEDWTEEETQLPGGNTHLWEESWDDDDTSEDFAKQLKEEMQKVQNRG